MCDLVPGSPDQVKLDKDGSGLWRTDGRSRVEVVMSRW